MDGTKGFMRGEHYCIALALLKEGESSKERVESLHRRMACTGEWIDVMVVAALMS